MLGFIRMGIMSPPQTSRRLIAADLTIVKHKT
jgi:hypothetical protein